MTKRYGRAFSDPPFWPAASRSPEPRKPTRRSRFADRSRCRTAASRSRPAIPVYQVGSYAPDNCDIYQDPDYGYGFVSGTAFFPVRAFNGRWVVTSAPTFFSGRYADWRDARVYRRGGDRVRYERRDVRQDDRRSDRRDNDRRNDRKDDRRDGNDRWRRN